MDRVGSEKKWSAVSSARRGLLGDMVRTKAQGRICIPEGTAPADCVYHNAPKGLSWSPPKDAAPLSELWESLLNEGDEGGAGEAVAVSEVHLNLPRLLRLSTNSTVLPVPEFPGEYLCWCPEPLLSFAGAGKGRGDGHGE